MTTVGAPLLPRDLEALASRWIDERTAEAAGLRRVDCSVGGEIVGQEKLDCSGIAIPYCFPGSEEVRDWRIRRDHPEMELRPGGSHVPRRKYLGPPGRGNMLFIPRGIAVDLLMDARVPVVMTEGELKTLALLRLAEYGASDGAESPSFLPLGLQGCWNFRGVVGKTTDAAGSRVDVRGPIPDLARIAWTGRRVIIVFDADVAQKLDVQEARRQLTIELEGRGAEVSWFLWPRGTPVEEKGIDDLLAAKGPEFVLGLLGKARPVSLKKKRSDAPPAVALDDWRSQLMRNADYTPKASLANAITALRLAPEFSDALAFDEFHVSSVTLKPVPWSKEPHSWSDVDDIFLAEFLQRELIGVPREIAGQAVEAVSREHTFHPVRDYLNGLAWDGAARIDDWLTAYLGALGTEAGGVKYVRAVGGRWLLSAVARIMQPGSKADCCLILEGEQGIRKSMALRTLAGEWFADELADLGTKDAALQTRGVWIIELAELDAMNRSEAGRIKAFMSRTADRFRPPYGKRVIELPRQCVFAGSVNRSEYLADETGGRRFWPVKCGSIDVDALARDRDQLWAEALVRYRAGEPWWLESGELVQRAQAEQDARYEGDAWDSLLSGWTAGRVEVGCTSLSVSEALEFCLDKPKGQWTRGDGMRVGKWFKRAGWERFRDRGRDMEWRYRRPVPTWESAVPTEARQVGTV